VVSGRGLGGRETVSPVVNGVGSTGGRGCRGVGIGFE